MVLSTAKRRGWLGLMLQRLAASKKLLGTFFDMIFSDLQLFFEIRPNV
jgi:hypothetical protein